MCKEYRADQKPYFPEDGLLSNPRRILPTVYDESDQSGDDYGPDDDDNGDDAGDAAPAPTQNDHPDDGKDRHTHININIYIHIYVLCYTYPYVRVLCVSANPCLYVLSLLKIWILER